jgi:hypothetical protein
MAKGKAYIPEKRFKTDVPIIIPSLKRFKKSKTPILMIDSCLEILFRYYEASNVHVVAQEYEKEDKDVLKEKYPTVNFHWYDKRLGIIKTFNTCKEIGCKQGDYYLHHDDDVSHSHQFSKNPTILAMEHVMKNNMDRVGVVTVPSISIHHFKKASPEYMSLHCNPAQLVLINSKPAKECKYDKRFENFRSDTDFTMQIAEKGYIPVMLNRYFSFMHTVPLSKITYTKSGGRKFENHDNVKSGNSAGGIRTQDKRKYEYDEFNKKWPLVTTTKNYKMQILKKSVVSLTNFQKEELKKLQDQFDFSLVNDKQSGYYKDFTPEFD